MTEVYLRSRNKFTSLRRRAIKDYFWKSRQSLKSLESFGNVYLHGKTNQANDIILVESIDTVRTEKKEIVELFNEHFIQISDRAVVINGNDYCNDFEHRPSVNFIYEHSKDTHKPLCSDYRFTNKALVAKICFGYEILVNRVVMI